MRDSNYKSIPLNKAAVSITTNLYDRRALDSTSDRPLVNSLNHLTFLTSSSAKVRETLSMDGGLERLIHILHECKQSYNEEEVNNGTTDLSISKQKKNAIIAWKWTLAFQCLVLIGTRGTEEIRKRVVEAGIIPIIATVLDNYLLISKNFDNQLDNTLSSTFMSLVNSKIMSSLTKHNEEPSSKDFNELQNQLNLHLDRNYSLHKLLNDNYLRKDDDDPSKSFNFRTDYPIIHHQPEQLNEQDLSITSPRLFLKGILIPKEDDVVWSLQLLAFISKYSNLKDFLQYTHLIDSLSLRSLIRSNSTTIPPPLEQDDLDNEMEFEIISNFSSDDNDQNHLLNRQRQNQRFFHNQQQRNQPELSNTQSSSQDFTQPSTQSSSQILIQNNLSNDQIIEENDGLANTTNSTMKNDSNNNDNDNEHNNTTTTTNENIASTSPPIDLYSNIIKTDIEENYDLISSSSDNELQSLNDSSDKSEQAHQQQLSQQSQSQQQTTNDKTCFTKSLIKSILNFEKSCLESDEIEFQNCNQKIKNSYKELKYLNLVELSIKLNKHYQIKYQDEKFSRIHSNIEKRHEFESKWNYKSYFEKFWSNNNNKKNQDFNKSTFITHQLNIFPLVEKFTIKNLNSSDMCYWSGVIMRNSCRKDENRGGVRQCASFQCGKWENFPREFAKCRRCKRTKYCSKECQLKAWVYHKHWCVDSNNSNSSSSNNQNRRDDDQNQTQNVQNQIQERLPQ